MANTIGSNKDESCDFAAREDPRAVHTLRARFARDEIINSLREEFVLSKKEGWSTTQDLCFSAKISF